LWQSGLEVTFLEQTLFCLKEFLPLAQIRDFDYSQLKLRCRLDSQQVPPSSPGTAPATVTQQPLASVDLEGASIVELFVPSLQVSLRYQDAQGKARFAGLASDLQTSTRLLAMVVETMDTLLEDWYPSLGEFIAKYLGFRNLLIDFYLDFCLIMLHR